MRFNYWSCTKFADWVRGSAKPDAATDEGWNAWHKSAKKKRIRYWLAEEGLDHLQRFIYWPMNRLQDLRYYIVNRWIDKTHALTSTLKRGQWHEFDTRLLHSAFDSLVDFVEVEQAWRWISSDAEAKKYKATWYHRIFRLSSWRCPSAGLAYLEWASQLKADEEWVDKNDPSYGKPTCQALAAQETYALYTWWKEERPNRPDPMDASGWSNYCEKRREDAKACDDESWCSFFQYESNEDKKLSTQILEICNKMEQQQADEDTEMLIRLIKLRSSLWT
jgi:hypothetical protein